jgi:hypothetical protein
VPAYLMMHVIPTGTPERAQVLLAAAASPLLGHPVWGPKLVPRLCQTISDAGTSARHVSRACKLQFVDSLK